MSGGRFNYKQYSIAEEVYGYDMYLDYGDDGFSKSRLAAKRNPFEDVEMSEMFWDMLCVLHSLDWYQSGDNCESTYRDDVEYFKKKWFGKTEEDRVKTIVDNAILNMKEDIATAFRDYSLED